MIFNSELFSLFVCLSGPLSRPLFLSLLCSCICVCVTVCVSLCLSVFLSLSLSLSLSVYIYIYIYIYINLRHKAQFFPDDCFVILLCALPSFSPLSLLLPQTMCLSLLPVTGDFILVHKCAFCKQTFLLLIVIHELALLHNTGGALIFKTHFALLVYDVMCIFDQGKEKSLNKKKKLIN